MLSALSRRRWRSAWSAFSSSRRAFSSSSGRSSRLTSMGSERRSVMLAGDERNNAGLDFLVAHVHVFDAAAVLHLLAEGLDVDVLADQEIGRASCRERV